MSDCLKIIVSIILVAVAAVPALAEERYSLIRNVGEDFAYIGTSPSRMDSQSAYVTAGILTTAALLYTQDEKIRDYVQDHRSSFLDDIDPVAEKFGNGLYGLGFLAVVGGTGHLLKDKKLKETAILSFESFVVANIIGTTVKVTAGRARPDDDENSTTFTPLSFDSDNTSFPSGHTTTAFSIASVFAEQYDNVWIDMAAYGLATATGLQRVYDDQHWASDVFVGAVLGTVVGKSVVHLHGGGATENVIFLPVWMDDITGAFMIFRF